MNFTDTLEHRTRRIREGLTPGQLQMCSQHGRRPEDLAAFLARREEEDVRTFRRLPSQEIVALGILIDRPETMVRARALMGSRGARQLIPTPAETVKLPPVEKRADGRCVRSFAW
jgi:hypothetical protein